MSKLACYLQKRTLFPSLPPIFVNMAALAGKDFPEEVAFMHVPYVAEKAGVHEVCGMPVKYDASKGKLSTSPCSLSVTLLEKPQPADQFGSTIVEFKNKKVVVVAVPGAFTPTCSEKHVPTFLEQKDALKAKGVDQIIVIAYNDPFVMSAWGKANGVTDDFIVGSLTRPWSSSPATQLQHARGL